VKLIERFRISALLLVLVATVAFCVSQRNMTLLLVAGPLAVLSWYVTEGPKGRSLPRWVQTVLLVVLVGWTIVDARLLPELSDAMGLLGRFVLWLLLIKLYAKKAPRDYAHVLVLSAVLVMAGTLQSVEFSFSLLVFAYGAIAVWTILLFQLWSAREKSRDARARAVAEVSAVPGSGSRAASLVPVLQPAFGRHVVGQFRWLAVLALVVGAILSTVVFIIFPRELSDLARRNARFGVLQSGFSGEVRLFTNDRITESRREVFTIEWRDSRDEAMQFAGPLYLRGAVLDRYDPASGRWAKVREPSGAYTVQTKSRRDGGDADPFARFARFATVAIDERFQTYIQRVSMRSLASDVVFSVWVPLAIACDDKRIFEVSPSTLLVRDTGADRLSRLSSYEVKVQPFPTEQTVAALMRGNFDSGSAARSDVRFPVTEVVELARAKVAEWNLDAVVEDGGSSESSTLRWQRNRRVARAIADWLQSPAFSYTTDLGAFVRVSDEDPITSFLTRYRFGHCEYFASALVALCQSLGIESRLVTGYVAIEYDEAIQQYIVRESNAHAWAEVRVGDYAWMTLDPTPQTELAALQGRNRSWADRWRWAWDRVEFLWNSQVVSFDSSAQATLADRFGAAWQRQSREWLGAARMQAKAINDYFRLGPAGYLWMGLVALAAVLAVFSFVSVRRRFVRLLRATGVRRRDREAKRILRQSGFWLDALDALERNGLAKPESRPPLHHVEALRAERPAVADAFAEVVEAYYRVRFAGEALDARGRAHARTLVEKLGQAARG